MLDGVGAVHDEERGWVPARSPRRLMVSLLWRQVRGINLLTAGGPLDVVPAFSVLGQRRSIHLLRMVWGCYLEHRRGRAHLVNL